MEDRWSFINIKPNLNILFNIHWILSWTKIYHHGHQEWWPHAICALAICKEMAKITNEVSGNISTSNSKLNALHVFHDLSWKPFSVIRYCLWQTIPFLSYFLFQYWVELWSHRNSKFCSAIFKCLRNSRPILFPPINLTISKCLSNTWWTWSIANYSGSSSSTFFGHHKMS